jgi:hypothetical protein
MGSQALAMHVHIPALSCLRHRRAHSLHLSHSTT